MRLTSGPALTAALAVALGLGRPDPARAQMGYAGRPAPGAGSAARPYAFSDESLFSINRSYLGYSNFVYRGPDPPAPGYATRYGAAVSQGYTPARRGRWFGRRPGSRY